MNNNEYNFIIDILDKYVIRNSMMINGTQYNLINLDGFKSELKKLKPKSDNKNILDKSKIEYR